MGSPQPWAPLDIATCHRDVLSQAKSHILFYNRAYKDYKDYMGKAISQ